MRLVFMDFIEWEYTPDTPWERPLGGTQSGLCYLMTELAKQGHQVSFINHTKEVKSVNVPKGKLELLSETITQDSLQLDRFDVAVIEI